MKYIELVKGLFTADHETRAKQEKPYIAYSKEAGKFMFSISPKENQLEYKMVDLGLPSGLLWADRNVGATSEYDYGLYFQWGDTKGYTKEEVDTSDDTMFSYDLYRDSGALDKYNTDGGLTVLESSDDAATVHMGADWRMPTINDWWELMENTTCTIVQADGTLITPDEFAQNYLAPGIDFTGALKCTSKINNNSILFAPSLSLWSAPLEDLGGYIWSSELGRFKSEARTAATIVVNPMLFIDNVDTLLQRHIPLPVRGVRMPEEEIIMTSESNPVVMSVCYNQGWAANPDYMTKREAEKVTDIGNAFAGPYSGGTYVLPEFDSDVFIRTFNELQYFTSISNLSIDFQKHLTTITIPHNVKRIGSHTGSLSLTDVYYLGTKEEWNNISGSGNIGKYSPKGALTIHCTDGDIEGLGQNERLL